MSLALLFAQAVQADNEIDMGMSGTVGHYPVAMQVRVRDNVEIVQAHYSYASQATAIPLTIEADADALTLTEPGGGAFHLHYVGSAADAGAPHDIYHAIGLAGTWVKGPATLPVQLHLQGSVEAGADVPDCAYYPAVAAPAGKPAFPDGGCTHTPDQKVLDRCIQANYTGEHAVSQCITQAMHPCREDQMDINRCVGNLSVYLDRSIKQMLQAPKPAAGALDAGGYRAWDAAHRARCEKRSGFSPQGTGYGADIAYCMAGQMLGLLQRRLMPARE